MRDAVKVRGFILVLTLIMTSFFAAIMGASFFILTSDYRSLSYRSSEVKAYWLSEAGLAYGVRQLKNSAITWSGNISSIGPNVLGGGTFQIDLTKSGSDVLIIATGTYSGVSRKMKVTQTASFPSAFSYAIFGSNSNNATLAIGDNNGAKPVIDGGGVPGGLFYKGSINNDAVLVRNSAKVQNGYLYADQISGGGTYTPAPADPNPLPTYPTFDATSYDSQIAVADSAPRSNLTLSNSANLNLAGQTLYYNTVTVQNSATITGPGTIVARTGMTIKNSGQIGSNVNVISKTSVTAQDSGMVASGGSIYARTTILLRDTTNVSSSLIANRSNGTVQIQNSAIFSGVTYSDILTVNGSVDVKGSLVANRFGSNQIAGNAKITFDKNYLPAALPNGFQGGYAQKADSWKECSTDVGVTC